jgi:hypothetical protein
MSQNEECAKKIKENKELIDSNAKSIADKDKEILFKVKTIEKNAADMKKLE